MGGKRVGRRSSSSEILHPRISSAGSTKSSPQESTSFYPKKDTLSLNSQSNDDPMSLEKSSPEVPRKNSFDIISLLENQDGTITVGENEKLRTKHSGNSSELPSFWHFVEPDRKSQNVFQCSIQRHQNANTEEKSPTENYYETGDQDGGLEIETSSPATKSINAKRLTKRRKVKKVQSAKGAEFIGTNKSFVRVTKEDHEWIRVLTPPGTGLSSVDSANIDSEEDELIRRYFSGLSSAGSSISWAEDAMESEFTTQLTKLWEGIETVCGGGTRPEKMSDGVYEECLQWRKAFPNPDLHRFSSSRNCDDLSPIDSQTLEEEQDDADAAFSSVVHSPSRRSNNDGKKCFDQSMSLLQTNFRALNCATPRPNIEKSTEYVSAWLSECQNSFVPEGDRPLLDYKQSTALSPSLQVLQNSPEGQVHVIENDDKVGKYYVRLASDGTLNPYSKSQSKFVIEPEATSYVSSTAYHESDNPLKGKNSGAFPGRSETPVGTDKLSPLFSLPSLSNTNVYQSKIHESDEEDENDCCTPTEIVSFRTRVQRPISSRIRDHAITPIATGTYAHSPFSGRHQGGNISKHTIPAAPTSVPNTLMSDSYRSGGRFRMFESFNDGVIPDVTSAPNRIKSGLVRQGHSLAPQFGRSKQQAWSRHSGDELAADANYVTSLYETYPSGLGTRSIEEERVHDISSNDATGPNYCISPNSAKVSMMYYDRSRGIDYSRNITECEDHTIKSSVSWLMNR